MTPLARADLPVDTVALARSLVGATLVRELPEGRLAGRIVETEAYLQDDPASHAYRGPTRRNRAMFLERGHAYVYLAYGLSWMLNVSGGPEGVGEGVLLRALEPLEGADLMARHRGGARPLDLTRGPGRLAMALRIGPDLDGAELCAPGPLWLAAPARPPGALATSPRIGITKAADLPLRFYERGNAFVSGPRRLSP